MLSAVVGLISSLTVQLKFKNKYLTNVERLVSQMAKSLIKKGRRCKCLKERWL